MQSTKFVVKPKLINDFESTDDVKCEKDFVIKQGKDSKKFKVFFKGFKQKLKLGSSVILSATL